ncbi:MAG TPA: hypothetical protein VIA18_25650 [Polyangia bacterium]|jgi:hypothetical protein|nr:hypothetical protein [Polyangia bacterium]
MVGLLPPRVAKCERESGKVESGAAIVKDVVANAYCDMRFVTRQRAAF